MKNIAIIFGVILSCFLLLVTPCINAIEYKEEKENYAIELSINRYNYENYSILNNDSSNGISFYFGKIKDLTENETHISFNPINIIYIFWIPYDQFTYWPMEDLPDYIHISILKVDKFPIGIIRNNFICAISNQYVDFVNIFP